MNRLLSILYSGRSLQHWSELVEFVPELAGNRGLPQNPLYHPEGPVDVHITNVIDAAAPLRDASLSLTALFHDIGKARAHHLKPGGRISQSGHENYSAEVVGRYRTLIEECGADFDRVLALVQNHMRTHQYESGRMSSPVKRTAFESSEHYDDLIAFAKLDNAGKRNQRN